MHINKTKVNITKTPGHRLTTVQPSGAIQEQTLATKAKKTRPQTPWTRRARKTKTPYWATVSPTSSTTCVLPWPLLPSSGCRPSPTNGAAKLAVRLWVFCCFWNLNWGDGMMFQGSGCVILRMVSLFALLFRKVMYVFPCIHTDSEEAQTSKK